MEPTSYPGPTRAEFLRKSSMALAGVLVGPGLLAACGEEAESGGAAEISWAVHQDFTNLSVMKENTTVNNVISNLVHDGLHLADDDGVVQLNLASELRQPDPLTYVYTLRTDARFADGSQVTVEDVIASLNAARADDSVIAYSFAAVDDIGATGENELTIRLKDVDAGLPGALCNGMVYPKKFLEMAGGRLGTPAVLIEGSGPYRVERFTPSSSATLVRNPHYSGSPPVPEVITIVTIKEEESRYVAFRSGEIDGSFRVPPTQIKRYGTVEGAEVHSVSDLSTALLVLNVKTPPFDDIHVRRAIVHAWDRQAAVDAILGGNGSVARTPFVLPEQLSSIVDEDRAEELLASIPQYEFDLEAAAQELAQSGHADGFSFDVDYPGAYPELGKAMQVLADSLKGLGIETSLREVPTGKWVADLEGRKTPSGMGVLRTATGTSDPREKLDFVLSSNDPTGLNWASYHNPRVDRLVAQTQGMEGEELAQTITDVMVIVAEDLPYASLWHPNAGIAARKPVVFERPTPWYASGRWADHLATA